MLPIAPTRILPAAVLALFLGVTLLCSVTGAFAQTLGPDEGVSPEGAIVPSPSLTPSQKSALYQAVLQQRGRRSTSRLEPTIGAPVSRAAELSDLPDQAGIDDTFDLKYAMVEGDVVVVDPIRMRVVDIIHGSVRP